MIALIYNPNSGGFRAETLEQLQQMLRDRRLDHRLYPTERAGHASELAARAVADGADTLACYGGDGTTYEVINGLPDPAAVTLLPIPCGTGNDLLRTLGLPRDACRALQAQLDGKARAMDLVLVNEGRYLNVAGIGLDVAVLREYALLRGRGFGNFAYKLAVFRAMHRFRPMRLSLRIDGGDAQAIDCSMLSVGNGKYIGGGMCCVPDADPFDGVWDGIIVRPVSNWLIALLLPLFFIGKHTRLPLVRTMRGRTLEIDADEPFWMQMDGELSEMRHARIRVQPGGIHLRLPGSR